MQEFSQTRENMKSVFVVKLMEMTAVKTFIKWDHKSYKIFLEDQDAAAVCGKEFPMPDRTFEKLREEISSCRICREEFGFEPRPILFGNQNAKIMQISQAPSRKVHETGLPFNDASGKKLRREWYRIEDEEFYNPDNFYIVSTAHCFPGKAPGGGDKRPPKHCAGRWLRREMELVNNEIYILVGGVAAEVFFPGRKITELVFEDHVIGGKPAYILPHPSPLNVKWFRDHPEFEQTRIPEIAACVHRILDIS